VSGSWDKSIIIWNLQKDVKTPIIKKLTSHDDKINVVKYSTDGKFIVSGSDDHSLRLWNIIEGK